MVHALAKMMEPRLRKYAIASPGPMWLDHGMRDTAKLQSLLIPYPAKDMQARPVGDFVSNARNQGAQCLQASGVMGQMGLFG